MLRDFDFIACFPCFCRLLHFTDKLIWFGKSSHFQTNWQKFRQPGFSSNPAMLQCSSDWPLHIRRPCASISIKVIMPQLLLLDVLLWLQRTAAAEMAGAGPRTQCPELHCTKLLMRSSVEPSLMSDVTTVTSPHLHGAHLESTYAVCCL